MPSSSSGRSPLRRARWSFWVLVAVAVLAAGSLDAGLRASSSPVTGLRVALSGAVLIVVVTLAARVMFAMERARRRARDQGSLTQGVAR